MIERKIIVRLECVIKNKCFSFIYVLVVVVVVESFTALGRNDARPIAGRAKLIAGLQGECCLGDELDDVGDDADEHDVTVSVEPLRI